MKTKIILTVLALVTVVGEGLALAYSQKNITAVINGQQKTVVLDELTTDEGTFMNSGNELYEISCIYTSQSTGMTKLVLADGEVALIQQGGQIKLFSCKKGKSQR